MRKEGMSSEKTAEGARSDARHFTVILNAEAYHEKITSGGE
jgi:hypothetical protein